jgi:hypothetical protein
MRLRAVRAFVQEFRASVPLANLIWTFRPDRVKHPSTPAARQVIIPFVHLHPRKIAKAWPKKVCLPPFDEIARHHAPVGDGSPRVFVRRNQLERNVTFGCRAALTLKDLLLDPPPSRECFVAMTKYDRPIGLVMAVDEYEKLSEPKHSSLKSVGVVRKDAFSLNGDLFGICCARRYESV